VRGISPGGNCDLWVRQRASPSLAIAIRTESGRRTHGSRFNRVLKKERSSKRGFQRTRREELSPKSPRRVGESFPRQKGSRWYRSATQGFGQDGIWASGKRSRRARRAGKGHPPHPDPVGGSYKNLLRGHTEEEMDPYGLLLHANRWTFWSRTSKFYGWLVVPGVVGGVVSIWGLSLSFLRLAAKREWEPAMMFQIGICVAGEQACGFGKRGEKG